MLEQINDVEGFDLESLALGYDKRRHWRLNNPEDAKLQVLFFKKAKLRIRDTLDQRRPIYISKDYVTIKVDPQTEMTREVTEEDKERFKTQYQAFLSNSQPEQSGTPIEYLKSLDIASRYTCKSVGVKTVQELANATPEKKMLLGDKAAEWIEVAKRYLSSEDPSISGLIEKENEELKQANLIAQQQIADLQKLLATEEKKKVKDAKNSPSTASGDS